MEKPTREFKLNISSVRGVETNTSYPFTLNITCKEDLAKAVAYDHVGAEFADGKNTRGRLIPGYRSRKTFRRATAVIMDCDNTESDTARPYAGAMEASRRYTGNVSRRCVLCRVFPQPHEGEKRTSGPTEIPCVYVS